MFLTGSEQCFNALCGNRRQQRQDQKSQLDLLGRYGQTDLDGNLSINLHLVQSFVLSRTCFSLLELTTAAAIRVASRQHFEEEVRRTWEDGDKSAQVRICDCKYPHKHWSSVGAGGGSRTHTPLRAADFESAASAIPPLRQEILKNSMNAPFRPKVRPSLQPPVLRSIGL